MMLAIFGVFDVELMKVLGLLFLVMGLAIGLLVMMNRVDEKERVIDRMNDDIMVLSGQIDEMTADFSTMFRDKEVAWQEERERLRAINYENQQLKAHRETLRGVVDNLKGELADRERKHLRACETTFALLKEIMDKNKEG